MIYIYNVNFDPNLNLLKSEDIFILMSFPGLDMLRVFISRILRKKVHLLEKKPSSSFFNKEIFTENYTYTLFKFYVNSNYIKFFC